MVNIAHSSAAALIAGALLAGCSSGGTDAAPDPAEFWESPAAQGWSESIVNTTPDFVALHLKDLVKAKRDVILLSLEPRRIDPQMEVMASRVGITLERATGRGIGGGVLMVCTSVWPPTGWGTSSEVEGFRVKRGDQLALYLYLRGTTSGEWTSSGFTLRYRTTDGRVGTLTSNPEGEHRSILHVRPSGYEFDDGEVPCASGTPLPPFEPPRPGFRPPLGAPR